MKLSGSRQIAERYVKALFEVAKDAPTRAKIEKDFASLQAMMDESEALRALISNPLLTRAQQAQAMDAVLAAMRAQPETKDFITLLARQKRLDLLPAVIVLFGEWASKARGELRAEVVSATALKDADTRAIAERLSKTYGKTVIVTTRLDPSLLGGMVINIGSVQLDSSLSGKMRRLKNSLQAA